MDKQKLIDKYLSGQLSEKELNEFEALKKSDVYFQKEVSFLEDLKVVSEEDERQKLKYKLQNRERKIPKKKNTLRRVIMIIIGILLILAAIFGYQYEKKIKSPDGIYAAFFEPLPNTYRPVTRDSYNNVETQGFTAYENGDYVLAAEKFEESIQSGNRDLSIKFYQGVCYGAMGNLPLAIQNMENVKRWEFPYLDEAYWYLGLFYLKQKNFNQSIVHFQDYIELAKDEEKRAEAIKILKRIM
jgi:tetratricopeptide (TPR) repeat protein